MKKKQEKTEKKAGQAETANVPNTAKKSAGSMISAVLVCMLGSLVVSFALNQVLKPAGFSPGGVTGLAVLVNKMLCVAADEDDRAHRADHHERSAVHTWIQDAREGVHIQVDHGHSDDVYIR